MARRVDIIVPPSLWLFVAAYNGLAPTVPFAPNPNLAEIPSGHSQEEAVARLLELTKDPPRDAIVVIEAAGVLGEVVAVDSIEETWAAAERDPHLRVELAIKCTGRNIFERETGRLWVPADLAGNPPIVTITLYATPLSSRELPVSDLPVLD